MTRAAELLSNGLWPWDEKRWPFYSILLVPGIWFGDVLRWGRLLSLGASIGIAVLVYKFYIRFVADFGKHTLLDIFTEKKEDAKKYALLACIVLAVSPVYAYWSFRVMADPVFTLLILLYSLVFINIYRKSELDYKHEIILALLLLCITMTRLEGLFMFFGTMAFFVLKKFYSKIVLYVIPQLLIYAPFTFYAKFLYDGPVNNDYLKEAQTFVFNLERFNYFLTYTIFILVFPPLIYFLVIGLKELKKVLLKSEKNVSWAYIPLALFILQELLIGFIWTPSLPRIYMPIIPFFVILTVFGFQAWDHSKNKKSAFFTIMVLTIAFAVLQYNFRLYFLGASKILFAFILASSFGFCVLNLMNFKSQNIKLYFAVIFFVVGFISSSIIVFNQKDIYKSVYQASALVGDIAFSSPSKERIAYSDETGTATWYLKNNYTYYLDQNNKIQSLDDQYKLLEENEVSYLLITNEFNRGSNFIDPKADPRYALIGIFSIPIYDLADYVLNYLGLMPGLESDMFVSKVYKVL
jgi:hypothetical protein